MATATQSRPTAVRTMLYPNAPWYFALAILTTWIGFANSYFMRLGHVTIFHHIHGASAGLWTFLVLIQPILYHRGKLALHRRLGHWGVYTLVPIMVAGGLILMHSALAFPENYPPNIPYQLTFIDLFSLIFFSAFVILGIRYGRNLPLHARFMVCTILIVLPPAITRALFLIPWFDSFSKTLNGSFLIVEAIILLLIFDDRRYGRIRAVYPLALALFASLHLSMNYAGHWTWWRTLADRYGAL